MGAMILKIAFKQCPIKKVVKVVFLKNFPGYFVLIFSLIKSELNRNYFSSKSNGKWCSLKPYAIKYVVCAHSPSIFATPLIINEFKDQSDVYRMSVSKSRREAEFEMLKVQITPSTFNKSYFWMAILRSMSRVLHIKLTMK